MADGVFLAVNPITAARSLLGQAFALFLQGSLLRTPPEPVGYWEDMADALTRLFLHGMLVRDEERQSRVGEGEG